MANAQVQLSFIPNGRKNGQYLVHAGHKYSIKSQNRTTGRIHWRCSTKDCPSTINTQNNLVTSIGAQHTHDGDLAKNEVDKFIANLKFQVRTTSKPIPSLYKEEIAGKYNFYGFRILFFLIRGIRNIII